MFAERLKTLRKQQGISQVALAGRLNISQQAVGKWETGRSAPDPGTLKTLADLFGVTVDFLLGRSERMPSMNLAQDGLSGEVKIPILGTVKAGYGAYAFQEEQGYEVASVKKPEDYFYLIVRGESMEPRIFDGDLALVHQQPDVLSGELAVVLIDGEEGTLKKVIKKDGAVILQPFNPACQTQIFMGEDLARIQIIGRVVETKARW